MFRISQVGLIFLLLCEALSAETPLAHEHSCKPAIANARCGSIEVLESPGDPATSRRINIEFVQIRATGKQREPDAWVDVAGGPGVPSTPGASQMLPIFGYVLEHRDIVFFDQRGTGASNPLHCDLREAAAPGDAGDFLPTKGVQQCYRRLAPEADLVQYNTTASVEDLDQLRAALGYDKITLHALSYGTRLSQAYIQAHPEHVRAAIFEGPVPPGLRIPVTWASGMQRTLSAVLEDCRHDAGCKPLAEQIDLKEIAARQQLTFTSDGTKVQFTVPQFFETLRTLLYDAESSRRVPLLLSQVSRGDNSQLASLYHEAHRDDPSFSWPLWLSVTCAEDTPFIHEDQIKPATAGTLLGDYRIRQQQRACEFWPVPPRDPRLGKPASMPVLLMVGEFDLVTPALSSDELRRYFPHGRQVVIPHGGHLLVGLDGIECLDNIEGQFLSNLNPQSLDVSCLSAVHREPFIVKSNPK